jgi:hypothetical protein
MLIEHSKSCVKWRSLKANMILNCLEVVFWAAVVFVMTQANLKFCAGRSCVLSWIVCALGGILRYIAIPFPKKKRRWRRGNGEDIEG